MKSKNSTPRYSFTTGREGKDYWYQVIGDGMTLLEGGYGRSRHDAAECARAAIRQLEAGGHYTQRRRDWQDCIPADPGWIHQPSIAADSSFLPF